MLRALFCNHRAAAAVLLALALALRILIPSGYMPVATATGIAVQICPGRSVAPASVDLPSAHHAMPGKHDRHPPSAPMEMPCAFAGLTAPTLAATDAFLLVTMIDHVVVAALRPLAAAVRGTPERLRPPLRAPPLLH